MKFIDDSKIIRIYDLKGTKIKFYLKGVQTLEMFWEILIVRL
jgi:hypothetical protein